MDRGMQMGEVGRVEPVASLPGAARLKELREKIVLVDALIHADDCESKDDHSTRCKASGDVLGLFDALFPAASAEGSPSHPSSPSQDSAAAEKEFSDPGEAESPSQWAYRLGLKLDRWIPWNGVDNFQRIENAVLQFVEMKKEPSSPSQDSQEVREAVHRLLRSYRCQHTKDEDGDGASLLDVLSPGETVAGGLAEIELLTDEIAETVALLPQSPKGAAGAANFRSLTEFERQQYTNAERSKYKDVGGEPSAPKTGLRGAPRLEDGAALTWTTEQPRRAGWYWHRSVRNGRATVGEVYMSVPGFMVHFAGAAIPVFVAEILGEWAGPMPAPGDVGSAGGAA